MQTNIPEFAAALLVDELATAAMADTPADKAINSLLLI
jgi:hypothetical protein